MELNSFIEKFAEQFEETEQNVLTPEVHFKELDEWSSLMALAIIAMVDEEYGIRIKGDDVKKAETIIDLYNIINSRL
ncbi:acyl carrier protein [Bacteroides sp. HPS0048]|uniref:acyl carrier protein n=1 Tax=Bacteroides sp. HPS0048 TaxID=1078089 RepID=UPI003561AB31